MKRKRGKASKSEFREDMWMKRAFRAVGKIGVLRVKNGDSVINVPVCDCLTDPCWVIGWGSNSCGKSGAKTNFIRAVGK